MGGDSGSARDEHGFTLVELLVVVIIIGVLASIAIPTYLRQRRKAWRAAATSDLKNAAVAAESYAVNTDGTFSGLAGEDQDSALLRAEGFNRSPDVEFLVRVSSDGHHFCLEGTHADVSDRVFVFRSVTGVVDVERGGATCVV